MFSGGIEMGHRLGISILRSEKVERKNIGQTHFFVKDLLCDGLEPNSL